MSRRAIIIVLDGLGAGKAGCLLTVSDTIGAEVVRISNEELQRSADDMMALALDTLKALN